MKRILMLLFLVAVVVLFDGLAFAEFDSNSANITNQYFPIKEGDWFKSIGFGAVAGETWTNIAVGTEVVDSVNCLKLVVSESVTLWFAQDTEGIVWVLKIYFHSSDDIYTLGSGFSYSFMPADPKVGDKVSHRFPEPAGTYSEVTKTGVNVELGTGLGPYENCVETASYGDYVIKELEYYCPNIGIVKHVDVGQPAEWSELSEYGSNDKCPNDPNKTEPGDCGCGTAEGDCDETEHEDSSGSSCFINSLLSP